MNEGCDNCMYQDDIGDCDNDKVWDYFIYERVDCDDDVLWSFSFKSNWEDVLKDLENNDLV